MGYNPAFPPDEFQQEELSRVYIPGLPYSASTTPLLATQLQQFGETGQAGTANFQTPNEPGRLSMLLIVGNGITLFRYSLSENSGKKENITKEKAWPYGAFLEPNACFGLSGPTTYFAIIVGALRPKLDVG